MNTTASVKVPKVFWSDHVDRGCIKDGFLWKELTKHYVLHLTPRDLIELLDDAHHYCSSAADYGWDMQWLVSSARATKRAIIKQIGTEKLAALWVEAGYPASSAGELGLRLQDVAR